MMILRSSALVLGVALSITIVAACGDEETPAPATTTDAATTDAPSTPNDSGTQDSNTGSGSCTTPTNGVIATQAGTFNHQLSNNKESNQGAETLAGTIPCESTYDPTTPPDVGSWSITCWGQNATTSVYYGIKIKGFGTPAATGELMPVGTPDVSNKQVSVAWEAGPSCGSKDTNLRGWTGVVKATSALQFSEKVGTDFSWNLSVTDVEIESALASNAAQGTFSIQGTGKISFPGL